MKNNQLAGLSNKQWIIVLVIFVLSLFAALNEDFPNWLNVIGGIIVFACAARAAYGFFSGR
jgi:hypothetical protein